MRICVITYYCDVVVGPGAQLCTLLEVWVLGVGMSTLGAQTDVRRGSGAPSTDGPGALSSIAPSPPAAKPRRGLIRGSGIGFR